MHVTDRNVWWVRLAGLTAVLIVAASPARAQDACRFVCAPSLKIEPTITFSNLFGGPRVRTLSDGTVAREPRDAVFEIILALDIPTELPRLAFTAEAIWTPVEGKSVNPFTGRTAADLGVATIRDNPVELEFEVNLKWLLSEQTRGWVSSHFDVVDKFSPAERPNDNALYTHKLNLELDTALAVFSRLPEGHWLRRIELEGSLDYVATGIPGAGDEIPKGQRFLDGASRWSFSLVLVIPVAPL